MKWGAGTTGPPAGDGPDSQSFARLLLVRTQHHCNESFFSVANALSRFSEPSLKNPPDSGKLFPKIFLFDFFHQIALLNQMCVVCFHLRFLFFHEV